MASLEFTQKLNFPPKLSFKFFDRNSIFDLLGPFFIEKLKFSFLTSKNEHFTTAIHLKAAVVNVFSVKNCTNMC